MAEMYEVKMALEAHDAGKRLRRMEGTRRKEPSLWREYLGGLVGLLSIGYLVYAAVRSVFG